MGCFSTQSAQSCRRSGCKLAASVRGGTQERWAAKFKANVQRDVRNIQTAHDAGYRVAMVWECAVEHRKIKSVRRDEALDRLEQWLRQKPVLRLRQPLVRFVRCRTVAKVLSIGFDVRMCFRLRNMMTIAPLAGS